MVDNFERMLFEIKNELLQDENIRRLLYYNDADALSKAAPSVETVKDYVNTKSLVALADETLSEGLSNFISLSVPEIEFNDVEEVALIKISIAVSTDCWELKDNKIRPLQILARVKSRLKNIKFHAVGTLVFDTATLTYYNKQLSGYTLVVGAIDESNKATEF